MKFRTLKLQRDRECPVCGDNPTVTKLIDYELFCGITPAVKAADKGTVAPELESDGRRSEGAARQAATCSCSTSASRASTTSRASKAAR